MCLRFDPVSSLLLKRLRTEIRQAFVICGTYAEDRPHTTKKLGLDYCTCNCMSIEADQAATITNCFLLGYFDEGLSNGFDGQQLPLLVEVK